MVIKNFPNGVPLEVEETVQQIFIRVNDPRWKCLVAYIFPGRNPTTIYLARLGGEKCDQPYTLTRPVGAVEELMSLDLGFGRTNPQFKDVEIFSDEEDPVNFGSPHIKDQAIMHEGLAFKEDFYAVDDGSQGSPMIVPVHKAVMEDFIVGAGFNPYFTRTNTTSSLI